MLKINYQKLITISFEIMISLIVSAWAIGLALMTAGNLNEKYFGLSALIGAGLATKTLINIVSNHR